MEMISALLVLCEGNPSNNSGSPHKEPGPCFTTATWRCRKDFSQWEGSFQRKLHCHWLKLLWQHQIVVVRQGPVMQSFDDFLVVQLLKKGFGLLVIWDTLLLWWCRYVTAKYHEVNHAHSFESFCWQSWLFGRKMTCVKMGPHLIMYIF